MWAVLCFECTKCYPILVVCYKTHLMSSSMLPKWNSWAVCKIKSAYCKLFLLYVLGNVLLEIFICKNKVHLKSVPHRCLIQFNFFYQKNIFYLPKKYILFLNNDSNHLNFSFHNNKIPKNDWYKIRVMFSRTASKKIMFKQFFLV